MTTEEVLEILNTIIEALKEYPRPTGYWRDDGLTMWCSNCGHGEDAYFGCYDIPLSVADRTVGWARSYPAYCPNCGAKMENK